MISGQNFSITVPVIEWNITDWNIRIKFVATRDQRDTLVSNVVPGAVDKLYEVLGNPHFYDTTLDGSNTLTIYPLGDIDLKEIRHKFTMYVQTLGEEPQANGSWFIITIEGPAEEWFYNLFPSDDLYPSDSLYPGYAPE